MCSGHFHPLRANGGVKLGPVAVEQSKSITLRKHNERKHKKKKNVLYISHAGDFVYKRLIILNICIIQLYFKTGICYNRRVSICKDYIYAVGNVSVLFFCRPGPGDQPCGDRR